MAFTPSTLSVILQTIGGVGMRFVSYRSDDPIATLTGTDYFARGTDYGLRLHDLIFVSPVSGSVEPYVLVVTAVDSEGNVTAEQTAFDAELTALAGLDKSDGNFIVGDGTTWVAENGATARTSLGLGSAAVANLLDEDDMASDSATAVPSQQSVKAFASNSANVTYAQSGVGAVTRAILDYIREREKSVTEYGVDNTGATDVAATLEACLEMGGSWWVPAGDYKITSALEATITSSLYVRCHPDARFFAPGRDGNMINIVVPSDGAGLPATGISFIWDGGFIDQSEQMVATVVPFIATYPPPTGLVGTASSTDGILIRGNYDDGSVKTGIYLAIVRNIRGYAGEHWQSAGGDSCIAFAGCRTMIVENSTFVGSRDQAVYFNNDSAGTLTDSSAVARGNTCINCAGGLAAKRSVRYVSFTENMIDNALTGLSIGHEAGTGTKGGVISNNEIRRCARSILGYLCDSVAIHGNIIKDAGALLEDDTKAVSTYNLYGIILAAATNCTVFGNRGNGVSALWSGALNAFVQLEGYDPGSGTVSSEYNDVLDNTSNGWPRPVQETTSEANYNYIDRNYDAAPSIAARALKTGANPRGLRWEVLAHSATQVSHTGDTNQTTLVTVSIPGRMLGSGGVLRVTSTWTRTSAGTTTFRIRYNGSLILAVAVSGNGVYRDQRDMINRGATNSQVVSSGAMTGGWGTASGSLTTLTVDTTQTYDLDFQVLLSNSADVGALESYIIEYLAA